MLQNCTARFGQEVTSSIEQQRIFSGLLRRYEASVSRSVVCNRVEHENVEIRKKSTSN